MVPGFHECKQPERLEPKDLDLLPHIGGAYRIDDKSVMRFGWGRYISPSSKFAIHLVTSSPVRGIFGKPGNTRCRLTGYWTVPRATLSNPFPNSITPVQQPLGQSLGRYTNLGNQSAQQLTQQTE